jgi:hypothetical protein
MIFAGIITKATPGGDQFVSIDGKRTYFDIGPTQNPFNEVVKRPHQQGIFKLTPTPYSIGEFDQLDPYVAGGHTLPFKQD